VAARIDEGYMSTTVPTTRPGWHRSALVLPVLVLMLGLAVSWAAAAGAQDAGNRTAEQMLDRRAELAQAAVTAEVRRYLDVLGTVAAGLAAQSELTRTSFFVTTAPLTTAQLHGATGVSFVVDADSGQIGAVERLWRQRGAAGLRLKPVGPGPGHLFAVFRRALDGTPSVVTGTDASAVPEVNIAIRQARASGAIAVSPPFVRQQDRGVPHAQRRLFFVAPVYTGAGGSGRGPVLGWVTMSLRGQDFFGATLRSVTQGVLDANLRAADGGGGLVGVAAISVGHRPSLRRRATVAVAQGQWVLEIAADPAALPGGRTPLPLFLGAGGSLFTALLGGLVYLLTSRWTQARHEAAVAVIGLSRGEREVERQAAMLSGVLNRVNDGVVVVDECGTFLLRNPAAERILGPVSGADGPESWQGYFGVFRPDGSTPYPTAELPLVRAITGESPEDVEMVIRNAEHPDGAIISVSASPLVASAGQRGAVAIFRDITAVRQAEEKFAGMLESAPDAIVGADRDGRIVLVNVQTERLFGYRRDELVGAGVESLIQDGARDAFTEHRASYLHDPQVGPMSASLAFSARRKDGSEFLAETSLSAIDTHGGIFVTAIRDITEQRRQQHQLANLNAALVALNGELEGRVAERTEQLEEQASTLRTANADLESFSYSVSHDLRAPLRTVDGFAKLIEQEHSAGLDDAGRRYLGKVRKGATQMGDLIDGLLAFSRLQRQSLTTRRVDMAQLVTAVWAELANDRAGRSIELTVGALPPAVADPRLLSHVLANLVGNAVKYTRCRDSARIDIGADTDETGQVSYYVRDNGTGFDMRYADKLFEVFQRLHRAEDYEGTGIGLALAARIIRRHGGCIWAESEPDHGATFWFTLTSEEPSHARPVVDRAARRGQPERPGVDAARA
jgi:PAS domain S-box-containing protein